MTAAAIAIFGSSARGDLDSLSDRDVLIVCDDKCELTRRQNAWERLGWSVAPYCWDKLQSVFDSSGLFIEHLKREAIVILDEQYRLSESLSSFEPKRSYDREIQDNLRLFELAQDVPNCLEGRLWAADVWAVAFRNFGIMRLANEGVYSFSYAQVLTDLLRIGVIDASQRDHLANLRFYKHCYRYGCRDLMITDGAIEQMRRVLCQVVGAELRFRALDEDRFEDRPLPGLTHSYGSLRLAEREILRLTRRLPTNRPPEIVDTLNKLRKEIASPRELKRDEESAAAKIWSSLELVRNFCVSVTERDDSLFHQTPASWMPFHLIDYPRPGHN